MADVFWLAGALLITGAAGCAEPVYGCKVGTPKACEYNCTVKGAPRSCTLQGVMLDNGTGVERDERKALEFYTRGCLLGDGEACHLGGLLLYLKGKSREMTIRMFDAGCRLQLADSCAMGAAVRASSGAPAKETAELLWLACKSGSAIGCLMLGGRHLTGDGVVESRIEARRLFERACKLGESDACALANTTTTE